MVSSSPLSSLVESSLASVTLQCGYVSLMRDVVRIRVTSGQLRLASVKNDLSKRRPDIGSSTSYSELSWNARKAHHWPRCCFPAAGTPGPHFLAHLIPGLPSTLTST
jgi:hypothetical protein